MKPGNVLLTPLGVKIIDVGLANQQDAGETAVAAATAAGDERADWFERDPLLADIRQEPRFRQIVDGIRDRQEQRRKSAR